MAMVKNAPDSQVEADSLVWSATMTLISLMEREGVSRAELGRRTGRTRGTMTLLLSGKRNLQLRTLADLAYALGYRLELHATKI